jgi:predicted permease
VSWSRFFRRASWDAERARELDAHLQIEIDDGIARGLSPADARAAAYRRLGNTTLIREEIYHMNTLNRLETVWQDLRYATRLLRRAPGFTFVAVLSLMLGIGANTAIFQLLDAVRLRTLPIDRPQEFVEVKVTNAVNGRTGMFISRHPTLTNPIWERIRADQHVFSSVFAWSSTRFDLAESGESKRVQGIWVSGGFFGALGVRPQAGRLLTTSDDQRGCGSPAVVLGDGFWRRQFGADPSAIGRRLKLDGTAFEIVGVAPLGFFGVEVGHTFDVAAPICAEPLSSGSESILDRSDAWWLGVMGRLAPGVSIERASANLATISPGIFRSTVPGGYTAGSAKEYVQFTLGALPSGTGVSELRSEYQQPLSVLLSIAGLVLLIACGNLANLLIARGSAREREMAVRLAIGASRARLIRQLMVETLLLASAGAALGGWLAGALSRALVSFLNNNTSQPLSFDLALDWRVYAFTIGVTIATCLACGLAPAFRSTRTAPSAAMRSSGRGLTDNRERFGLRRALVVGQMALSLVLLVGALLFVRTFWNLANLDPGFRTAGILVAGIDFSRAKPSNPERALTAQALTTALGMIPGVDGAAAAAVVPLEGSAANNTLILDGVPRKPYPNINNVGREYFRVMGMSLRAGRGFTDRDTLTSPPVAVVSESFSRTFLAGADPIGTSFRFDTGPGEPDLTYRIVGVVSDAKYRDLHDPIGTIIYLPDTQDPRPDTGVSVLMHASPGGPTLTPAIVSAVQHVSPLALVHVRALDDVAHGSIVRERLMATLSGFFAVLAGLLAAVGLYGVMSYAVTRRRNEIGIRMALGADAWAVLRLVLKEAASLVAIGLVVGAVLAYGAARAASALFFNLNPGDVPTMLAAMVLLVVIAALAAAMPARRATRLQPTEALKEE